MTTKPSKEEFIKRLANMILFLEKMSHSGQDVFVDDPIELGEDFIKIGTYLIKGAITKDQFVQILSEIWDDAPSDEAEEEEGDVIFEAN